MIELLAVFFVGFYSGWKLREFRAMMIVRSIEKRMLSTMDVEESTGELKLLHVEISSHHGVYIAHNKATNQFLLQGTSYKDVIQQLQVKYPEYNILTEPVN